MDTRTEILLSLLQLIGSFIRENHRAVIVSLSALALTIGGTVYQRFLTGCIANFTEKHSKLKSYETSLQKRLAALRSSSQSHLEAINLLKRVGTGNHSEIEYAHHNIATSRASVFKELDHASLILSDLSGARHAVWIGTCRQAIADLQTLARELGQHEKAIAQLESRSLALDRSLSRIIDDETSILYTALREFSNNLHGYLNTLRARPRASTSAEATLRLRMAAALLYNKVSLVSKNQALNADPHDAIHRLDDQIDPDDILHVRRGFSPLPEYAFPSKKSYEQWVVSAWMLNVRSQPTTDSRVLFTAERGETVSVLDDSQYWWYVRMNEGAGWVGSRYLAKKVTN